MFRLHQLARPLPARIRGPPRATATSRIAVSSAEPSASRRPATPSTKHLGQHVCLHQPGNDAPPPALIRLDPAKLPRKPSQPVQPIGLALCARLHHSVNAAGGRLGPGAASPGPSGVFPSPAAALRRVRSWCRHEQYRASGRRLGRWERDGYDGVGNASWRKSKREVYVMLLYATRSCRMRCGRFGNCFGKWYATRDLASRIWVGA